MRPSRGWVLLALPLAIAGCATTGGRAAEIREAVDAGAEIGVASYYASGFHGRRTASGERYDERALTAAHPSLPFGTRVRVTHLASRKTVVLRINDRGPHVRGRILDVSFEAARALAFLRDGIARVRVDVLGRAAAAR